MIRRPPRSTLSSSSAASDVYKRQVNVVTSYSHRRHIVQPTSSHRTANVVTSYSQRRHIVQSSSSHRTIIVVTSYSQRRHIVQSSSSHRTAIVVTSYNHCRHIVQPSSSHRTANVAALSSSFSFSSTTGSLRHDRGHGQRTRLCLNPSAMTPKTLNAAERRSNSNDESEMQRATIDSQQLAVSGYGRCRPTTMSESGDLWTAVRCEDVATTSRVIVDAVQEHRRPNLSVLRRAAATAASTATNCV